MTPFRKYPAMATAKRTHQYKVLFNDAEHDRLLALCKAAGRKPGTYCRLKALEDGPDTRQVVYVNPDLQPVLGQLGRIGNNLNQIAHHLNEGHVLNRVDALALQTALSQVHSQLIETQALIREGVNHDR